MASSIQWGIDTWLESNNYKQQQIALVTNNAARTVDGVQSRIRLLKEGFRLKKLFSPEHGITVQGEDGAAQQNSTDALTDLPIISLYGNKRAPTEEDLHDIDVVLFDIPDVGCRFYTYLWTMTYVMEACAHFNKLFVVLDRPNPIGALIEKAEGPLLDEANCSSFIGRWNIPLKHCCTLGELALYFAATRLPKLNLEIMKVKNYLRHQTAVDDFVFTPTSPAIQNIQAALLYPGTGLLEGVNINEARGTTGAFTMLGAPWMDPQKLMKALNPLHLPGIIFSSVSYKAMAPPFTNETCYGIQLGITHAHTIQAVHTGLSILQTMAAVHQQQLQERLYKTHANPSGTNHLQKLLGVKHAWELIRQQQPLNTDCAAEWWQTIHPFLLYQ